VTYVGTVPQSNGGGSFSVCNNILSVQFMGAGLKEPAEELAGSLSSKSDVLIKILFSEPIFVNV
jgi:hypothetical protein